MGRSEPQEHPKRGVAVGAREAGGTLRAGPLDGGASSEEGRVGEEGRCRGGPEHLKKKIDNAKIVAVLKDKEHHRKINGRLRLAKKIKGTGDDHGRQQQQQTTAPQDEYELGYRHVGVS